MSKFKIGSKKQPFPKLRPDIRITPSRARPVSIDCKEVAFAAIPKVGSRTCMAWYDLPGWTLTSVTESIAARPAQIHDLDCVEIETTDWEPDTGWTAGMWTFFARLTKKTVQILATSKLADSKRTLCTFLDEGFEGDWGREDSRQWRDSGRLILNRDGSYRLKKGGGSSSWDCFAAGMFRVAIGGRTFTCLRIIDLECHGNKGEKQGVLADSFRTKYGRTVLLRRYNGRLLAFRKGSASAVCSPLTRA